MTLVLLNMEMTGKTSIKVALRHGHTEAEAITQPRSQWIAQMDENHLPKKIHATIWGFILNKFCFYRFYTHTNTLKNVMEVF